MMGWSVSDESVEALKKLSARLQEIGVQIHEDSRMLLSYYEENQESLGVHSDSIRELIDLVQELEGEAKGYVSRLALRLERAAMIRRKHLEENPYDASGSPETREIQGQSGSVASGQAVGGEKEAESEIVKQFLDQNVQKDRLPRHGTWENPDRPGEGHFTLDDHVVVRTSKGGVTETMTGAQLKEKYGIDGVDYRHNEPDFTPFVDETLGIVEVEEIPSFRDGAEGTYSIAVSQVAERLGWSKKEVERYMEEHRLTWHESADRRRIMPVPTEINEVFKHTGGISKQESMEAVRDVWSERFGGMGIAVSSPPEGYRLAGGIPSAVGMYSRKKKENRRKSPQELKRQREEQPRIRSITIKRSTG